MKTYFLIIAFFFLQGKPDQINQLKINEVNIGCSTKDFEYFAGQPDKREDSYSEIEEKEIVVWWYGSSKLKFIEDRLVDFNFQDSLFTLKPLDIQVGQSDSKLKSDFRNSYKMREGDDSNYVLRIYLHDTMIGFKVVDKRIKEIFTNSST